MDKIRRMRMKKVLSLLACLLILGSFAVARADESLFLPEGYREDWVIDQKTNWIDPELYFATISKSNDQRTAPDRGRTAGER